MDAVRPVSDLAGASEVKPSLLIVTQVMSADIWLIVESEVTCLCKFALLQSTCDM